MGSHFTRRERRKIAGCARTFHERLDGPSNEPGENGPDVDRLLEAWKETFPDEESFIDRLAKAGLTEADVREQARATRWPADEPLPDWVTELESLLDHVTSVGADDHTFTIPHEAAFGELLAGVVGHGFDRLSTGTLSAAALEPAVEWFFDRLELLTVRVLYVEFMSYLDSRDPELVRADPVEFDDPPTQRYEAFVEAMLGGGVKDLCLEYPVLARRWTQVVNQWVGAVTELDERLRQDRSELEARFDVEGPVKAVEPLAEDTHAGGRVPMHVEFDSGSVVYKPRDVGGGPIFYTILDRLDDHLTTPAVRTPIYLCRDEYGWMETISHRNPDDEAAVRRYYQRAGVVACLGYALSLGDLQFENVVASGEHPMVVDAETVFTPGIDPTTLLFSTPITRVAFESTLVTGLFPFSSGKRDDKRGASIAGLGSKSESQTLPNQTRPVIEAVNTDVMSVEPEPMTLDGSHNTPTLDGEDQPPEEYLDAIWESFEQTYETIRQLHADGRFFAEIIDEKVLDGVETRVINRPTNFYHSILRASTARDPLRDAMWLSVEMEELTFPFFDDWAESDDLWPVCSAERRALRRFDIPRIATTPTGTTPSHDGRPLDVTFDSSGYERARQRVASFDPEDRSRQEWLIRRSLTQSEDEMPPQESGSVTDDHLRREAVTLFDEAIDGVTESPGDGWVVMMSSDTDLTLNPADESVYHGRCGVALTAAALFDATGDERYRKLVAELLDPVVEEVTPGCPSFSLGGTTGVGSVVYTLAVVADLTDDERYRRRADDAVHMVTDGLVQADEDFDVMDGSAGTLLGLLAHYERHGGSASLERARVCGDRLLDGRVTVGEHRAWKTNAEEPLTGLSHGSAGIGYALARLGAATGESRYVEAVGEALEFEAALYDPDRNNWQHGWKTGRYVDRWCHGRSGIALARMGITDALGETPLTSVSGGMSFPTGLDEVLSATVEAGDKGMDDVCCGNLGRVEALLVGAQRFGRDESDAVELAGRCLARAERDGKFGLRGRTWSAGNPTFYKGLSGAAYTLLRVRDPKTLPCVLLLQ